MLVDEASVSLPEKKRAAEVICHELAHMWYGNLVTMRWWDDLWLNEAFATWMAFDIVAKWRPEWKMWNDFGHSRDSALQLDALDNTHAIYTEVGTPSEATQNFDLITYEKGAAVVRMLERYLGPKVFQRGVRRYIKRHSESNTVAADLWNALSGRRADDIDALVKPFSRAAGLSAGADRADERGGEDRAAFAARALLGAGAESEAEQACRCRRQDAGLAGAVGGARGRGSEECRGEAFAGDGAGCGAVVGHGRESASRLRLRQRG